MFKNPSFLFDIICTVVWLVLAVRYARKGLLASIIQLTGNLFSLLGAWRLSAVSAGWVFQQFLAGGLRMQVAASLAEGGILDLDAVARQYAGFLPASLRDPVVEACERSLQALLENNAAALADTVVHGVLEPLLTPVLSLALFFVIYGLLRMLVSLLVTVLGLVNKLPLIGAVNRGLGFLAGGITGLVDLYLVLCVLWALVVVTGGSLSALNEAVLGDSVFYQMFNMVNPFVPH